MYIIALLIFILIFCIIFIPIKIVVNFECYSKDYNINKEDIENEIKIYILRFIPIKRIKNIKKEKVSYNLDELYKRYQYIKQYKDIVSARDLQKLKKNIKFKKLWIDIGINTKNIVSTVYFISLINAVINMYIAKNSEMFCLNNTSYKTYISKKIFKIKIKSIVNVKLANTIFIKLIFKFMKGGKNNGEKTSNRKFNVNSHDFS